MRSFTLLLGLLVSSVSCNWDLAMLTSRSLDILGKDLNLLGHIQLGVDEAWALTYDPIYSFHYFAASGHPNASIFRVQVSRDGKLGNIEPLVRKQDGRIYGIAYDFESDTIFWTSGNHIYLSHLSTQVNLTDGKIVRKQYFKTDLAEEKILHTFEDEHPLAIAVEPCSKYLYWSYRLSKIDRSRMDGSEKETVVSDLHIPAAITIVQSERKIYWIDEGPGIHFRIGRAGLDGSLYEIVLNSTKLLPSSIVVRTPSTAQDVTSIFWTDPKQLWKYGLGQQPSAMAVHKYDPQEELVAVVSADAFAYLDQHVCAHLIKKKSEIPHEIIHPSELPCVQGTYSSTDESCICTPGYIGTLCETSVCYNYCLEGNCSMSNGKPSCKCPLGKSGKKCEVDDCSGYCYRGKCSRDSDGIKQCDCDDGWTGHNCDLSNDFCTFVCHKGLWSKYNCSCDEIKADAMTLAEDSARQWKIGVYALASIVGIQVVMIVALSVRNWTIGRRPRVRRTYKVTQPRNNKPQPARTSPDCAIAIENCCNMNICETPCYEPELRLSSGKSKKEEKKGLLGEIEIQPDLDNF